MYAAILFAAIVHAYVAKLEILSWDDTCCDVGEWIGFTIGGIIWYSLVTLIPTFLVASALKTIMKASEEQSKRIVLYSFYACYLVMAPLWLAFSFRHFFGFAD
jgi:hypothetical protein